MFFINDYCNKVKLFKYIKQYSNTLQKWTKELGKTYGYFEGYQKQNNNVFFYIYGADDDF